MKPSFIHPDRFTYAFAAFYAGEAQHARHSFLEEVEEFYGPLNGATPFQSFLLQPGSFGDFAPFILRDLCGSSEALPMDVLVGWSALNAYAIYLDKIVDQEISLVPSDMLLATFCLQMGLEKLRRRLARGEAEVAFSQELRASLKGELLDTRSISRTSANAEKNRHLVALSISIASELGRDTYRLRKASTCLLGPLQALDDIDDFAEDFTSGNLTPLISAIAPETLPSRREILRSLLRNGDLANVLDAVSQGLSNALNEVEQKAQVTPTGQIFAALAREVSDLSVTCRALRNVDGTIPAAAIDGVDERLKYLAVGSL